MRSVNHVSLRFDDNGTAHDDLVLRIGDAEWRTDAYYLALDNGMLADQEDSHKVRLVLARLIEQWRDCVAGLTDGQVCFLPYAFWDQATEWLRCEAAGGDLIVTRGWSDVEGWSIMPSDIGRLLRLVPDFRPTEEAVSIPREAFLLSIGGEASYGNDG